MNKFKRHRSRSANGIKISTGSTKPTFAAEGDNFKFTAMLTAVQSVAIFGVAAMKHFLHVFKDGITNGDTGRSNEMKMVVKNLL